MPDQKTIHAANLYDRRMQQKGLCSPVRRDGFIDGYEVGRKEAQPLLEALEKVAAIHPDGNPLELIKLAQKTINEYLK